MVNNLYTISEEEDGKLTVPLDIVQKMTECHLRPNKKDKNRKLCPVCMTSGQLQSFECKLFSIEKKSQDDAYAFTKGSWKPTAEEFVMKSLIAVGKAKGADPSWIKDGETNLAVLEAMKKEFKEVRRLWTYLEKQICAKDEIDMCKIRLKLKEPSTDEKEKRTKVDSILRQLHSEETNKFETIHMMSEMEVDVQRVILLSELAQNKTKLKQNIGTYSYLNTLRAQQTSGQSPDPCPICKSALQERWNMLPCGHCYCFECIQLLIGQTSSDFLTCSICRQKQNIHDITLIKNDDKIQEDDNKIKGDYSSKMEAVTKLVLKLRTQDENVKVLVFSNWLIPLKLLKTVFDVNDIKSELLQAMGLQKSLQRFKDKNSKTTALLIPVQLGSQGLNLIEATHVILVDPFLNPGDELQAIGRVHRIGQTKHTVVHKFLINNTIEEKIHYAISSDANKWDKNKVTIKDIKTLIFKNHDYFRKDDEQQPQSSQSSSQINESEELPSNNETTIESNTNIEDQAENNESGQVIAGSSGYSNRTHSYNQNQDISEVIKRKSENLEYEKCERDIGSAINETTLSQPLEEVPPEHSYVRQISNASIEHNEELMVCDAEPQLREHAYAR